jgi:hypothetical protein
MQLIRSPWQPADYMDACARPAASYETNLRSIRRRADPVSTRAWPPPSSYRLIGRSVLLLFGGADGC